MGERYRKVYDKGIKGDGISYPEKVGRALFPIIDKDCKYQYRPNWSNGKVYDFYLPSLNMIVELHGSQHYHPTGFMKCQRDNDRQKREIAISNGVEHYYEIDCRHSRFNWIKDHIKTIEEIKWDDIAIDWDYISLQSEKDLVKELCKYKKQNPETNILELSKLFGISTHAVRTYIDKGAELGWCSYNFKELQYESNSRLFKGKGNPNPSKTVEVYRNNVFLGRYDSLGDCCDSKTNGLGIDFQKSKVSNVCTGKRKHHKGYTFKYGE